MAEDDTLTMKEEDGIRFQASVIAREKCYDLQKALSECTGARTLSLFQCKGELKAFEDCAQK